MQAFLAFLLPLALYFLMMGLINRRWRPLMVSGPWDFAGLLFAASGFLFFGGPAILNALHERWRVTWLLNPQRQAQTLSNEGYYFWMTLSILYFLLVVGGSAYLLWKRRNQVAIYNIEPLIFEELLAHVLDRLGVSWSRSGQHWYVGYTGSAGRTKPALAESLQTGIQAAASPDVMIVGYDSRLELDASRALRHVTLYWVDVPPPLRQEIENELRQILTQVQTRFNPTGGWFLLIGSFLMLVAVFLTLLLLLIPALNV